MLPEPGTPLGDLILHLGIVRRVIRRLAGIADGPHTARDAYRYQHGQKRRYKGNADGKQKGWRKLGPQTLRQQKVQHPGII